MKRLFNHALFLLALMAFTAACSLIGVNQEAGAGVGTSRDPRLDTFPHHPAR